MAGNRPVWCLRGDLRCKTNGLVGWHRLPEPDEETSFNVASIKFGGGLTIRQASPVNGGWCAVKLRALSHSVKYVEKTYVIEFGFAAASQGLYGADFADNASGASLTKTFPLAVAAKFFARVLLVLQESDFEMVYGSIEASSREDYVKTSNVLLTEKVSGSFKGPTDIFISEKFTF